MTIATLLEKIPHATSITTNEEQIDALKNYQLQIAQFDQQTSGLTIAGINDKEGYKAVHDARMNVRDLRVAISKRAKMIRDDAVKFQKEVIAVEKELIDRISPIETRLLNQEEAIDKEKERLKAEEARKKAEALKKRLDAFMSVGCMMDPQRVAAMAEWEYLEVLKEETAKHEARKAAALLEQQKREAEAAELAAERERIQKEREAENSRIAAERAEMQAARTAIENERRILEQQKQQKEAAEKAEREAARKIATPVKEVFQPAVPQAIKSPVPNASVYLDDIGFNCLREPDDPDLYEEKIMVTVKELNRLRQRDQFLTALEQAGVSNWELFDAVCMSFNRS